MRRTKRILLATAFLVALAGSARAATNDYSAVDAIFENRCLDCHASQDPDAKLVLESFDTLMKGSENGPVIVPGKSAESRLVEAVEGTLLHNGKQIIMPPGRKRAKLKPAEIAMIKAWIDAGAHPPAMAKAMAIDFPVPKIPTKGTPRNPINVLAHVPGTNLIAVGRYREVELRSDKTGELVRALSGHHGNVNALAFYPDGTKLFAGSGEDARFGEIKEWNIADGKLLRTFQGHKDAVYSLAVSPDGKILASGSYDQKIKLWDAASGKELRTLSGHNGCIFGLSFRPDGKILASASGDHTVKLWNVATGERRDTLSQPLKDVYAVAFRPDGSELFAGGVDNRIRIWQISPAAGETTNPLLDSKFAAEGAILRLIFSPDGKLLLSSADDGTVRLWDAVKMKQLLELEKQPDWAAGLDFARDGKGIAVGRLDGSLAFYGLDGKPLKLAATPKKGKKAKMAKALTDKPEITRFQPRGMQRGTELLVKVTGTNLLGLTGIKSGNPKLAASISTNTAATETEPWLRLKAAADLPAGGYDISLSNEKGEGGPAKIYIDSFPNISEPAGNKPRTVQHVSWPLSYWGVLDPGGDVDVLEFRAQAGQTLVFDVAAKRIGSKADANLSLLDASGEILASQGEFEGSDPLLGYTISTSGIYRVRITETTDAGSPDYYYRLTIGELPEVVSVFPPSVQTNRTAQVQLVGYNLAGKDKVIIKSLKAGEVDVPIDPEKYRARRGFKVLATDEPALVESEPNDTPAQANPIPVPGVVCGQISSAADADLYRFPAKAGQNLILETDAARRGSPIDTKIEVLHGNGEPVERLQLRAVRDSAINFRGIDSDSPEVRIDNWQEMELNQYLYLQGEVCKLFRMPQGPDSGFQFYTSAGKRRDYFDTSATDHALDEPCYIVEPHPPGEVLQPNGLPVFPLYYANDDDARSPIGTDSRLHFTAPTNGFYLDARDRQSRPRRPAIFLPLDRAGSAPGFHCGPERRIAHHHAPAPAGNSPSRPTASTILTKTSGSISPTRPRDFAFPLPSLFKRAIPTRKGTINCDTNAMAPKPEEIARIKVTATAWVKEKK